MSLVQEVRRSSSHDSKQIKKRNLWKSSPSSMAQTHETSIFTSVEAEDKYQKQSPNYYERVAILGDMTFHES